MQWENVAKQMVKQLGVAGAKQADEALAELASAADAPWKRAVLDLVGEAVDAYGWEGMRIVEGIIDDLADGKAVDMSFASLKVRSDCLALLQNLEADRQDAVVDFLATVGAVLGKIVKAVIAAVV